ncbi:MAG: BrnT family toxin [Chloroflexota bacterium]|nr:BrnT family toxin [Chloroflexota bacterium]
MNLQFVWDEQKAETNAHKHGVTFEEAATVLMDSLAAIFDDERHSQHEARELIIGRSTRGRLIIVSFVERSDAIRIISARLATPKERRDYENNR